MNQNLVSPFLHKRLKRSEIGLNKAIVLVNRINLFWGLKWDAVQAHLRTGTFISPSYSGDDLRAHIVVACVDTSTAAPIATGWNEPDPGRDFHPLKISAFHGAQLVPFYPGANNLPCVARLGLAGRILSVGNGRVVVGKSEEDVATDHRSAALQITQSK